MVEVLRGFRGLNPLSFTDFWFVEVSGGFWAWFQWTLRSRQVVWMILLRMFFVFEGLWWKFFGALEAWIYRASPICGLLSFLEAFELDSSDLWDLGRWFGWFLFECSSYSKLSSWSSWRLQSLVPTKLLDFLILIFSSSSTSVLLKCLRKASIYRSLGVGERHAAKSDWWHMSHPDWSAYVITYLCEDCLCHHLHERGCLCHRLHVRWCMIGFCMTLGKFPLAFE